MSRAIGGTSRPVAISSGAAATTPSASAAASPSSVQLRTPHPPPPPGEAFSAVAEECGDHFHRLVCGLVAVAQCALLNFYLVTGLSVAWLWFLVADIVLILVLVYGFVNTFLYRRGQYTRFLEAKQPGEIPFGYALWLVNQISVVARLIVIYYSLGSTVATWGNAGANLLRTTGALSCVTGFFLVKSLLLSPPFLLKNHLFVFRIGAEAAIDVLDAIDFLDVLLVSSARSLLPAGLTECILAFAAATMLTPGCLMALYSFSRFGYITSVKGRLVRCLHLLFSALLCNFPLFIIRLYMWYALSATNVSAFVVKNVLFVYLNLTDLMRQILPEISGQQLQLPQQQRQQPGPSAGAAAAAAADVAALERPPPSLAGSRAGLITSP